jgi:hypothetical protein
LCFSIHFYFSANEEKCTDLGSANSVCALLICVQCVAGPEDEEDGDYTFKNSYSGLIDYLSKDLQIELNTPITMVCYDGAGACAAEKKCDAKQGDKKCAPKSAAGKHSDAICAQDGKLVTITTKDGAVYRAKKIVVTASPHVINTKMIEFAPALPAEVAEAFTYTIMNPITKVCLCCCSVVQLSLALWFCEFCINNAVHRRCTLLVFLALLSPVLSIFSAMA